MRGRAQRRRGCFPQNERCSRPVRLIQFSGWNPREEEARWITSEEVAGDGEEVPEKESGAQHQNRQLSLSCLSRLFFFFSLLALLYFAEAILGKVAELLKAHRRLLSTAAFVFGTNRCDVAYPRSILGARSRVLRRGSTTTTLCHRVGLVIEGVVAVEETF